jgi:hypothetical protein
LNLLFEQAFLCGLDRPRETCDGEVVLLVTGKPELFRATVTASAHVNVVVDVPEPVPNQRIHHFAVTQSETRARFLQKIWGA